MKHAILVLLFATATFAAAEPRSGSTTLHLSPAQIDEFDTTYWVTLTKEQQQLLRQRVGIAPTRLQIAYRNPDGERAYLGFNIAVKTSATEIKVLHKFLMSDRQTKKKREENRQTVTAGGARPIAKDIPSFAIDADGKLWRSISRQEFEAYVARDPKNIEIIYLHIPSSTSSKNTVASADTLRQVIKISKRKVVPTYVISAR
jgi:hypothetical protein